SSATSRGSASARNEGSEAARRPADRGSAAVEIVTKKHMMLFSGTAHPELSEEIAAHLGVPLSDIEIRRFASSEDYVRADHSGRGADVFVIQTHCAPVNEHIMQQLIMIDAMKR